MGFAPYGRLSLVEPQHAHNAVVELFRDMRSRTAMKTWSMPIISTGTGPLLSETLAAGYDNAISPLQNRVSEKTSSRKVMP
jgi:hypothetical protein